MLEQFGWVAAGATSAHRLGQSSNQQTHFALESLWYGPDSSLAHTLWQCLVKSSSSPFQACTFCCVLAGMFLFNVFCFFRTALGMSMGLPIPQFDHTKLSMPLRATKP